MKLLKVIAENLPLFNNKLEIDFFAEGRVSQNERHELNHLFGNFYLNKTISFTGINASGKTQILNTLSFVMYLIQAKSINKVETILFTKDNTNVLNLEIGKSAKFTIYFYTNSNGNRIHKLETEVKWDFDQYNQEKKYIIISEKLYTKNITGIRSKKQVFNFEETNFEDRMDDKKFLSLSKDVSLLNTYFNTGEFRPIYYREQLSFTNVNLLTGIMVDIPEEFLEFLDPSIEYLKFKNIKSNKSMKIYLKFKHANRIIELDSFMDLHKILSSGTVKGFGILMNAYRTIHLGGYMIIDELENHFNREIIATLIDLFLDKNINKNGGTLIYSTHYVELLEYIYRNDSIYIVRKEKGIEIEKLSNYNNRTDNKKSYLFINALLKNTAPSYKSIYNLKKHFKSLEFRKNNNEE